MKLEQQWHSHFRRAALAFKEVKGRFPFNHAESTSLPKEVSFYIEDASTAPPRTLATQWGQKKHYLFCVRGKTDAIADRVRNLNYYQKIFRCAEEGDDRGKEKVSLAFTHHCKTQRQVATEVKCALLQAQGAINSDSQTTKC